MSDVENMNLSIEDCYYNLMEALYIGYETENFKLYDLLEGLEFLVQQLKEEFMVKPPEKPKMLIEVVQEGIENILGVKLLPEGDKNGQ